MNISLNTSGRARLLAWNGAHPGFRGQTKKGNTIHSDLELRSSQLKKQSVRMFFRIRAVEYTRCTPRIAHTSTARKYINLFLDFFVISLDRTIWKMSRHVQFHRECAAHSEFTPLVTVYIWRTPFAEASQQSWVNRSRNTWEHAGCRQTWITK